MPRRQKVRRSNVAPPSARTDGEQHGVRLRLSLTTTIVGCLCLSSLSTGILYGFPSLLRLLPPLQPQREALLFTLSSSALNLGPAALASVLATSARNAISLVYLALALSSLGIAWVIGAGGPTSTLLAFLPLAAFVGLLAHGILMLLTRLVPTARRGRLAAAVNAAYCASGWVPGVLALAPASAAAPLFLVHAALMAVGAVWHLVTFPIARAADVTPPPSGKGDASTSPSLHSTRSSRAADVLADPTASFLATLRRPDLLAHVLFMSVNVLRLQLYVGTVADQLEALGDRDTADLFTWIAPSGGVLLTPLFARLLDHRHRPLALGSLIANLLGCATSAAAAVDTVPAHLVAFVLWSAFRGLLFTFHWTYVAKAFPAKQFGPVNTLVFATTAAVSFVQLPLRGVLLSALGSYSALNLLLSLLGIPLLVTPALLAAADI